MGKAEEPAAQEPPRVTVEALRNADPSAMERAADGLELFRTKMRGYADTLGAVIQPALQSADPAQRAAAAESAMRMRADAFVGVEALATMDLAVQQAMPGFEAPKALSKLLAKYQDHLREVARTAAQAAAELTQGAPPPAGEDGK